MNGLSQAAWQIGQARFVAVLHSRPMCAAEQRHDASMPARGMMPACLHARLPVHVSQSTHHGAASCPRLLPWLPSGAGWRAAAHRTDPGPVCTEGAVASRCVNSSTKRRGQRQACGGVPKQQGAAVAWRQQRQPAKPHLAALGGERRDGVWPVGQHVSGDKGEQRCQLQLPRLLQFHADVHAAAARPHNTPSHLQKRAHTKQGKAHTCDVQGTAAIMRRRVLHVLCCAVLYYSPHPPTRPPTHPHVFFQVELAAAQLNCLHPRGDHQRRAAGLVRNIAAGPGARQPFRRSSKEIAGQH